jgi:hypothetical protein
MPATQATLNKKHPNYESQKSYVQRTFLTELDRVASALLRFHTFSDSLAARAVCCVLFSKPENTHVSDFPLLFLFDCFIFYYFYLSFAFAFTDEWPYEYEEDHGQHQG